MLKEAARLEEERLRKAATPKRHIDPPPPAPNGWTRTCAAVGPIDDPCPMSSVGNIAHWDGWPVENDVIESNAHSNATGFEFEKWDQAKGAYRTTNEVEQVEEKATAARIKAENAELARTVWGR